MKSQYFGDKRDFRKYELLLDLVEGLPGPRQLTVLLMLTANDGSGEGRLTKFDIGEGRPELHRRFVEATQGGRRDVRQMHGILQAQGIDYHLWQDEILFTEERRASYFADLLRSWLRNAVVFLDPDVGLERSSKVKAADTPKYVTVRDLEGLLPEVQGGSVVVLYQHLQRHRHKVIGDLKERGARFGTALGVDQVHWVQDGDVAFLVAAVDPELGPQTKAVLTAHAERNGLSLGETHRVGADDLASVPEGKTVRYLKRGEMVVDCHGRGGDYQVIMSPDPPLPDPDSPEGIESMKKTVNHLVDMAIKQLMAEKEDTASKRQERMNTDGVKGTASIHAVKRKNRGNEEMKNCEVRQFFQEGEGTVGRWVVRPVNILPSASRKDIRCMHCHGAVRVHKQHVEYGPADHVEHLRRKDSENCKGGSYFKGTHRESDEPVE